MGWRHFWLRGLIIDEEPFLEERADCGLLLWEGLEMRLEANNKLGADLAGGHFWRVGWS